MNRNETLPLEDNEDENGDYLFPEIDDAVFEETMDSAIAEIMERHRAKNGAESLEKAITTEDIASAKRRGLVPQSGDWQKPKRWVRPEDADVPVDTGEKPRKKATIEEWLLEDLEDMDSIIRTALKDFPNMGLETFAEIYSTSLEGFSTEIVDILGESEEGDIAVEIHILNEEEFSVGGMKRAFSVEDGKLSVYHASFMLNEEYQGKGIAADINENVEEEYEKLGVSEIRLQANAEIGGYAWARQGYDFSTENELEEMQDTFSWHIERMEGLSVSEEEELINQVQGFAHSWQFARWNPTNASHGQHLGKELMLGTNWHAKKTLDKKSKGYKIGKGYFAAKRNEKNTA